MDRVPARTKGVLTAFTVFHLCMVLPWVFPFGPLQAVLPISGAYLRAIGVRQGWYMFAGGPSSSEHLVARVVRPDGSQVLEELPPVATMGPLQAQVDYRYRELEHRLLSGHPISIRDPVPAWDAAAAWFAARATGPVDHVELMRCGLPGPTIDEARAAGRDADWSARLRDPALWQCEAVHTWSATAQGPTPESP